MSSDVSLVFCEERICPANSHAYKVFKSVIFTMVSNFDSFFFLAYAHDGLMELQGQEKNYECKYKNV